MSRKELRRHFDPQQKAILDKYLRNSSEVIIVRQSKEKLFTVIKSNNPENTDEWTVMTARLTPILN